MIKRHQPQPIEDFSAPVREYTPQELSKFHKDIQKFVEDKPIRNPSSPDVGKMIKVFNYNDFSVAFGAFRTVKGALGEIHYLAIQKDGKSQRYIEMLNLLEQYQDWSKKQDWIENKKVEEFGATANGIPF